MSDVVACHPLSFAAHGVRVAIESLRETGLDRLVLPIDTQGEPPRWGDEPLLTDAATATDVAAVQRLLDDCGVRSSSCDVSSGNPLDPGVVATIVSKLHVATAFGVRCVVCAPGDADGPEQLATLHRHLASIGDVAARCGIVVCLDVQPGLCRHHGRMLETMQALDHPHLKLNFDTGLIHYYNERIVSEVALAKVCQHVRHVHLRDTNGEFGAWHFPTLGCGGAVDFLRTRELLRTCGFAGPYAIAIGGVAGEPPPSRDDCVRRISESVRYLRDLGYFD